MCRFIFVLGLAVTAGGIFAQDVETPEEVLSRYLGRVEVVDGTNVLIRTREWDGGLLVRQDGWTRYGPIDVGVEQVVHCGEGISFRYSGGPSLNIRVCQGVRGGDSEKDERGGESGVSVLIQEGKGMDIRVMPEQAKAFDVLSGKYVDFRLPFENIWKDGSEMVRHFGKKKHREISRRILSRSKGIVACVKAYLATNTPPAGCETGFDSRILSFGLQSGVKVDAVVTSAGNISGILYRDDVRMMAYLYSERESLRDYVELNGLNRRVSAMVNYGEDGEMSVSWRQDEIPRCVISTNGVLELCADSMVMSNCLFSAVGRINDMFGIHDINGSK